MRTIKTFQEKGVHSVFAMCDLYINQHHEGLLTDYEAYLSVQASLTAVNMTDLLLLSFDEVRKATELAKELIEDKERWNNGERLVIWWEQG
jgi:hypothetical protein